MVQNDLFILESPGPVIIGIVLPPGAALYALAIHAVDFYTGQAVNGVPVAAAYVCSLRTECPISLAGWQNVSSESWLPLVQNSANTALVGLFSGTGDTAGAPGVLLVVRIVAQNVVFAGVTVTRM